MVIKLSPEDMSRVNTLVASGKYDDQEQIISDALYFLEQRVKAESLRAKLEVGLRQVERGESVPWTPELCGELFERAKRRAAAGDVPDPDVWP